MSDLTSYANLSQFSHSVAEIWFLLRSFNSSSLIDHSQDFDFEREEFLEYILYFFSTYSYLFSLDFAQDFSQDFSQDLS